jgi:hypothetical protein
MAAGSAESFFDLALWRRLGASTCGSAAARWCESFSLFGTWVASDAAGASEAAEPLGVGVSEQPAASAAAGARPTASSTTISREGIWTPCCRPA